MFSAALFTITKILKQLRFLLTKEWIKNMFWIYTMNYYSDIESVENPFAKHNWILRVLY